MSYGIPPIPPGIPGLSQVGSQVGSCQSHLGSQPEIWNVPHGIPPKIPGGIPPIPPGIPPKIPSRIPPIPPGILALSQVGSRQSHLGFWIVPHGIPAKIRASEISRSRGAAKFRYIREIPRNWQKHAKYSEIRLKFYQMHVGATYLKLILAIGAVYLP